MKATPLNSIAPPPLAPGDTLGVVAPAGHFDTDRFHRGLAVLESMGFRTAYDETVFGRNRYLAGSDTQRAEQINRYFKDDGIKAVICARGGFGALRILSSLDYPSIRLNPKRFIGFSDITALLYTLNARCGLITYHGPNVTALSTATKDSKRWLCHALTSNVPPQGRLKGGITLQPGTASGQVIGGNLTTLCHMIGTPFQPDLRGRILLLEDIAEATYRIDRMLTQMKLAGLFEEVAGIALGSFRRCGNMDEIFTIVVDILGEYRMPISAGFPVGHQRRNLTIPLGIQATLDADEKRLIFHEPAG